MAEGGMAEERPLLGSMAAERSLKKIQLEATCFICSGYFVDPVILDCGHNFCRTCLLSCWRDFIKTCACPQCKATVEARNLIQNKQLASVVGLIKQLSDEVKEAAGQDFVCPKHQVQEPLTYCKSDMTLLCSECEQSLEHSEHIVLPVEEAAKEFKHCLLGFIQPLTEEREVLLASKRSAEEKYQLLLRETEAGKRKTMAHFQQFRLFVAQQERLLVDKFRALQDAITKKSGECMARFFDDISTCNRITRELEEKCRQPTRDFLKDVSSTMERFAKSARSEFPVSNIQELKWGSLELCDVNPFLEAVLNQFKDTLVRGYQMNKADVVFDPETAHPRFILSRKNVRLGGEYQRLPRNRKRFDDCLYVLGCQDFGAGRHSWDVLAAREAGWAVGVARKSVRRKGQVPLSPQEGIWAVGKCQQGQFMAFTPPDFSFLPLSGELKRIRVSLNCEGRQVTFFDADRATPLFATSITSVPRETFFPFFCLSHNANLTIAP